MSNNKVVGILGGMGPYATLFFFENILCHTDADKDWDHAHLVIDNNTKIPSRTRALLFEEQTPFEIMLESCKKLQKYPVDIIVIPCNSAQYWIPEIQKNINIPIMSIISVTTRALFSKFNCKNIAVLGGHVTYEKELYKKEIEKFGANHIQISKDLQKRSVEIIEKVKLFKQDSNSKLKLDLNKLIQDISSNEELDAIILGCTEFSLLKEAIIDVPFVDSSTELAKFVVNYTKN
jgi:aspartate racemase